MARFSIGSSEIKKIVQQLEPMFKGGFDNLPRILFKVKDKITASATNGESFVKIIFDSDIEEEGEFVVSGTIFANIIKKGLNEKVEISTIKDNRLSVLVGKISYQIALINANSESFDAPEFGNSKTFTIQAQDLKSAITAVSCCVDLAKQHLNCVMIHSNADEKNKIYVVATDGMRLGVVERKAKFKDVIPNLMVPKKTAEYMLNIIGEMSGELNVNYTENMIQISAGSVFYTSKLLDSAFPKYQSVIPTDNKKILEVKVSDLKQTIDSISQISETTFRIKLSVTSDKVNVSCEDNGNDANGDIEATYSDTKQLDVICNFRLLKEILDKISSSVVRIQLLDASTPMLIRSTDDDSARYVFMPFVS